MPKKVILHGNALKLLYTFLDYADAHPDQLADALDYDPIAFRLRVKQLEQQVQDGAKIEWDDLEAALRQQEREKEDMLL